VIAQDDGAAIARKRSLATSGDDPDTSTKMLARPFVGPRL